MNSCVEAISQGLIDGGVKAAYNFPGFYSQDIAERVGCSRISLSESKAYAEAYGASVAGTRTVVTFKNVGLNVAADQFLHSIIGGVNAGLVIVVTDDIDVWGSQESQDSRNYFNFFGGLWFEPDSIQSVYDISRIAPELSEKLDVPIVIRLTNDTLRMDGSVQTTPSTTNSHSYTTRRGANRFVVHPVYFEEQSQRLEQKNSEIQKYVDSIHMRSFSKHPSGVICYGAAAVNGNEEASDILKIQTLPLPTKVVEDFVNSHDSVKVLESGQPVVRDLLRALVNDKKITSATRIPTEKGFTFSKWERYEALFSALKEVKGDDYATGDITQFTVETYGTIDIALSLGSAVSTAIGVAEQLGFAYAITGDCSFNHEGYSVLAEAVARNINLNVVIIDNGVSWCTGAQPCLVPIRSDILPPGISVRELDYHLAPFSDFKAILTDMRKKNGVNVLHVKVPVGSLER